MSWKLMLPCLVEGQGFWASSQFWALWICFFHKGIHRVFPLLLQEHRWCHSRYNVSCPRGTVTVSIHGFVEFPHTISDLPTKKCSARMCVRCSLRRTGGHSSSQWTPSGQISAAQIRLHCIHLVANFTLRGCDCWPRQRTMSRSKLWPTAIQWVSD